MVVFARHRLLAGRRTHLPGTGARGGTALERNGDTDSKPRDSRRFRRPCHCRRLPRCWDDNRAGTHRMGTGRCGPSARAAQLQLIGSVSATRTRHHRVSGRHFDAYRQARACPTRLPGRLRTTWVVGLLREIVPEAVVARAAGLASLQHFTSWLPEVDTQGKQARELLRGNHNALNSDGTETMTRRPALRLVSNN